MRLSHSLPVSHPQRNKVTSQEFLGEAEPAWMSSQYGVKLVEVIFAGNQRHYYIPLAYFETS